MQVPTFDDHGSHVAGIVVADPNFGRASGVAPAAKIIPVSFMYRGEGSIQGAIQSINYAVKRGAQVINASWGGPTCSKILFDTIHSLADRSILFVSASGNLGLDLDRYPDYPAAFVTPANLVVAASNSGDFLAGFSNTSFEFVHIGAPGDRILSTVPGGYGVMSGTSMAAPMVAGAAALLLSARPRATLAELRAALLSSVDFKNYRVSSRGRLNVEAALNHLLQARPAAP
jgi:subtilisin family serine protease